MYSVGSLNDGNGPVQINLRKQYRLFNIIGRKLITTESVDHDIHCDIDLSVEEMQREKERCKSKEERVTN